MYIQANIGRNVGNEPMNDFDWAMFRGSVALAIYANALDIDAGPADISFNNGHGTWEGQTEENCFISLYCEAGFMVDELKAELAKIKGWYKQDAIALIVGSELI